MATNEQISKWAQDYEREVCSKFDFIVDRFSIGTTAGQGEYELPNYVSNIRMVLYKGKILYAKGGQASMMTGDTPFSGMNSIPIEYQTSLMGQRVIRLLPAPSETIAEYSGDLFTPAADAAAVIVEFYRTSHYDEFDNSKMLPPWLRRYILKDHICWKAFSMEGPQQDLRGSSYYDQKRKLNEGYLAQIRSNLSNGIVRVLSEYPNRGSRRLGRPVLPSNFGYPVR